LFEIVFLVVQRLRVAETMSLIPLHVTGRP
jgi:hypothetical protein